MCFGPVASFTASAALAVVGVATVRRVEVRRQLPLALIPIAFSLHQFIEGVLWLALRDRPDSPAISALAIVYLSVAFAVWPIAMPLCVYALESGRSRKNLLRPFVALGVIVSGYLMWFVINRSVEVTIVNHCILYDPKIYGPRELAAIYLTATFVPFLLSSSRRIVVLGLLNIVLCFVAFYTYAVFFISAWCFLAASVSGFIYFEISRSSSSVRAASLKV